MTVGSMVIIRNNGLILTIHVQQLMITVKGCPFLSLTMYFTKGPKYIDIFHIAMFCTTLSTNMPYEIHDHAFTSTDNGNGIAENLLQFRQN